MKRTVFVAIALLGSIFFITASHGKAAEVRGVTDTLIKIGSIGDHTGPTSNFIVPVVEASKNYFRYINDQGGIHGRKLQLIAEDSRYSIPTSVAAFKKLISKDQVLAILGPVSTGETRVLFRHIEKDKVPSLVYAADRSVMEPYKRYIFPTTSLYDMEWGVVFDYIFNELKPVSPKIASCYPDIESGKVSHRGAEKWAKFFNVKLHTEIIPLSAIDVTSQVLSMKKAGVTHVLIFHVAPPVALLLSELKRFGLNIPVFGISASTTEDLIKIAGEKAKNFIGASHYSSWYEENPGAKNMAEISLKYFPDALKLYGVRSYTVGWVRSLVLCEGIKRAGKDLNAESLVGALETLKDFDTQGLCGPITYTPTMHYVLNYNKVFKTNPASGKFIPITDWRLPPSEK
ncbi:MAG: ABC transporter substrate-binding protein [Thermodesulfobacteriota bacterium]